MTGYITPDEVLAYLADRAKPTACEADVRATIAACDTSGDGLIDFGEVGRSVDRASERTRNVVALPQRGRERKGARFHREGVKASGTAERAPLV